MGQRQVFTVELDGKQYDIEGDHAPSEAEARAAVGSSQPAAPPAQDPSGPMPSLAVGALRTVPALGRATARVAAAHPAATQKIIGAGISTAAGGAGAMVGGVPGAVVGASIRGVTPTQAAIRQTAGQLGGETPAVATNAARALGIQNYAKETTGLRVAPGDIIPKPNAANALEHYANAQERGILRLYGPDGTVVSGPEAIARLPDAAAPGAVQRIAGRASRVLAPLQAAVGVTDLAQIAEPNRRDIGMAGMGASVTPADLQMTPAQFDQYQQAHPPLLNAMAGRLRAAILARLGQHTQTAP